MDDDKLNSALDELTQAINTITNDTNEAFAVRGKRINEIGAACAHLYNAVHASVALSFALSHSIRSELMGGDGEAEKYHAEIKSQSQKVDDALKNAAPLIWRHDVE